MNRLLLAFNSVHFSSFLTFSEILLKSVSSSFLLSFKKVQINAAQLNLPDNLHLTQVGATVFLSHVPFYCKMDSGEIVHMSWITHWQIFSKTSRNSSEVPNCPRSLIITRIISSSALNYLSNQVQISEVSFTH